MKKFIYVLILLVFQMALGGPTKLLLTGQVKAIAFSPDSNYLACATDEEVFLYRSSDWRLIENFKIGKEIRALTFSPTKRLLAIARGSNVIVYDYNSWTLVALLSSHVDVYCVQFSPRGDVLLFGTYWTDANIHVYDTSSWKEITAFGASMTKFILIDGSGTLLSHLTINIILKFTQHAHGIM
jgi:WD40 repeat protein